MMCSLAANGLRRTGPELVFRTERPRAHLFSRARGPNRSPIPVTSGTAGRGSPPWPGRPASPAPVASCPAGCGCRPADCRPPRAGRRACRARACPSGLPSASARSPPWSRPPLAPPPSRGDERLHRLQADLLDEGLQVARVLAVRAPGEAVVAARQHPHAAVEEPAHVDVSGVQLLAVHRPVQELGGEAELRPAL